MTDTPSEPVKVETPPAVPPAETAAVPTPAAAGAQGDQPVEPKPERPPLTPEEIAQRKALRLERRKTQRKAARQAAKESKAAGLPPKPRAGRLPKVAQQVVDGELVTPDGAIPKITVAKLSEDVTNAGLTELFAPYGTILRAEVSRRRGRPTIGTVFFNLHSEVKRAFAALNGQHTCEGQTEPISIQYSNDSISLGELLKTLTNEVTECIQKYNYRVAIARSKAAKDILNKMVARRRTPTAPYVAAALLVQAEEATAEDLVAASMIPTAAPVGQLLRDEQVDAVAVAAPRARVAKAAAVAVAAAPPTKVFLDKTFDAAVPMLDKLEKVRWNRMANANLNLPERQRFRFVDILATPGLELWRWMVEDCHCTPAEAGTCFAILQNHYGYAK